MIDLRSWPKRWNEGSLGRIATLPESSTDRWSLVGAFVIGLAAGAITCYAVVQRSQIERLARRAIDVGDEPDPFGGIESSKSVSVTSHRSNHRPKAVVEVT